MYLNKDEKNTLILFNHLQIINKHDIINFKIDNFILSF